MLHVNLIFVYWSGWPSVRTGRAHIKLFTISSVFGFTIVLELLPNDLHFIIFKIILYIKKNMYLCIG